MFRYAALFAAAAVFAAGAPTTTPSVSGAWLVDTGHSDAQLVTDATTDYGKTKLNVTLGFGRVNGHIELNNSDLSQSAFNFRFYPATSMTPVISEDGKFLKDWLANLSNHTLVCFHSKGAIRTSDGKVQTTGTLVLTRVDRTIDATPSEAYAGPCMVHRSFTAYNMKRLSFSIFRRPVRRTGAPQSSCREKRGCSAKITRSW